MGKFLFFGATKGLGLVTAELFHSQGHEVIIFGRNAPQNAGKFKFYPIDMSNKDQLLKTFDPVLNEVGSFTGGCFFQRMRPDVGDLEAELRVSVIATQALVDRSINHLDKNDDHPFVFVSSVNSKFVSKNASLGYHITKASLDIMAKYFSVRYGHLNARFNTVNPSTFVKPETMQFYEKKIPQLVQTNPLNRMLTAQNIAEAILFLSSSNGRSFSGANLFLDNGASLVWPENL
ncbi:SDR family NAD(P)-dependent oxidoreductase [Alphaproteobacteria bacterium LSUCC0226]